VSIETSIPFSWLKVISPDVVSVDEIPLWGSPPTFPWENYSEALSEALHIPKLQISVANTEWKLPAELMSGMGINPVVLAFQIAPLQGYGLWILPRENLKGLLSLAVASNIELSDLEKEEWQEEFYEFLALEAVHAFHRVKYDVSLSPQITREIQLPENPSLCIDLTISSEGRSFTGRLAFTTEMRQSLSQKYTVRTLSYPQNLSEAVTVPIQLIAGQVVLHQKTWQEIHLGDFLLLDSCSLTLDQDKGRIVLVVNEAPLFRGKIKDGNIKILEYPSLQEVHPSMVKQKETEDKDFDEEEDTFGEDDFTEEYTEDDELSEDDETEEEEEADDEVTETDAEEKPAAPGKPSAKPLAKPQDKATAPEKTAKAAVQPASQTLVKPEEIPLTISIEVGRLQMSVKQLMELAPGNILELSVHPENGVDLVVSGRCIGKGELLKIGDALGVRILDKA
jgi:flagellar motor switch protein FliN/FliY